MDANGIYPDAARPAEVPIISASAMPISKKRSGHTFCAIADFVEPARSASNTTILSFLTTSSDNSSPYASLVAFAMCVLLTILRIDVFVPVSGTVVDSGDAVAAAVADAVLSGEDVEEADDDAGAAGETENAGAAVTSAELDADALLLAIVLRIFSVPPLTIKYSSPKKITAVMEFHYPLQYSSSSVSKALWG